MATKENLEVIMPIRKGKSTKGYPKLEYICFVYIENHCDTRRWVTISIQRVNYITILRKTWSYIGKLRTSWLVRKKLKCSYIKNKTTKGKENCQWSENISAIFAVNKQRKHTRRFGLNGCCPWPLIGKVFFIDIGKRMATIMDLTPCRVFGAEMLPLLSPSPPE